MATISPEAQAVVDALAKLKQLEPPILDGDAKKALDEFVQIVKDLATKPHKP